MEVLIVAPHRSIFTDSLGELADGTRVTAVGWGPDRVAEGVHFISVPKRRGILAGVRARVLRIAKQHTILQGLVRLSGFDEGVWFYRAVKRVPEASAAVQHADVIISSERDAIYTVWRWGRQRRRSGSPAAAVHGYPAGRAAIEQSRER